MQPWRWIFNFPCWRSFDFVLHVRFNKMFFHDLIISTFGWRVWEKKFPAIQSNVRLRLVNVNCRGSFSKRKQLLVLTTRRKKGVQQPPSGIKRLTFQLKWKFSENHRDGSGVLKLLILLLCLRQISASHIFSAHADWNFFFFKGKDRSFFLFVCLFPLVDDGSLESLSSYD